ncbi:MAG TPA: hypothetical protein VMZ53_01995 [Kofleriaceae bacterium]|nr:hypothetical protein [Kofleriaceae bacterium]
MRALALVFLAACGGGITADAQPVVSVLKQDGGCFALMTDDTPVSSTLGVSGTCNYKAAPRLLAGVDLIELVIDYGEDVDFAGTATAPTPKVDVTVDGVQSEVPVEVSREQRVGSRAYFIATFYAPTRISSDVRITVGVNSGFQTLVPVVFTTIAPPVSLSLFECPQGTQCELAGAVGSAHIALAVPGTVPQSIVIHSLLNGVPQPDPIPPVRTAPAQGNTEAVTAIPVPAAPDFTQWTIRAQLGESTPVQVFATIRAPELHALLTCPSGCSTLGTDEPAGLTIIAPAQIRPLQARVDTLIDGVPQVIAAPVELVQNADGTAQGLLALRSPSTTGEWQINVTVAGYQAPAIVTTIQ